jgi:hypothetical protein
MNPRTAMSPVVEPRQQRHGDQVLHLLRSAKPFLHLNYLPNPFFHLLAQPIGLLNALPSPHAHLDEK